MLESIEELHPVFVNLATQQPKSVECVRVDGATDEGPSHAEVQYWWTQRHIHKESLATLVTTRSSGSSYLNRVELQNDCLSLGHSNTFIPSTLRGSCTDPETGALNESVLKENLSLGISAYINRVSGCPCGETTIQLYRGADATTSEKILTFKGTRAAKEKLKQDDPEMYANFQFVWDIRQRHMINELPSPQYIFFLVGCFNKDCQHTICKKGEPTIFPSWYEGGPDITNLPLPVADVNRPWGNVSCDTCETFCAGHYSYRFVDTTNKSDLNMCIPPPSHVLKDAFTKLKEYPPPAEQKSIADA